MGQGTIMRFPVNQPYNLTTLFSSAHPGIDIAPIPAGKTGVPCFAPEGGVVVSSGYVASLEGNYCIIRGNSGYFYYFGHFASPAPAKGTRLAEGQKISTLGMTGLATGVHTHHEVRRIQGPGQSIDPMTYYKGSTGGVPVASANFINQVFWGFLGRPADADAQNHYGTGQYSAPEFVVNDVFNSKEANTRRERLAALDGELAAARAQATDFGAKNVSLVAQLNAMTADRDAWKRDYEALKDKVGNTPTTDDIIITRTWFNSLFDRLKSLVKK